MKLSLLITGHCTCLEEFIFPGEALFEIMTEGHITKTTKDLLKKVADSREQHQAEEAPHQPKKVSFSSYLSNKDQRKKALAEKAKTDADASIVKEDEAKAVEDNKVPEEDKKEQQEDRKQTTPTIEAKARDSLIDTSPVPTSPLSMLNDEEDSEDDIRIGSNRESSIAKDEDSDADTDIGDSPQRKGHRLLRVSDIQRRKSVPKLNEESDEEQEEIKKRKKSAKLHTAKKVLRNARGEIPLHNAALEGDLKLVKTMVEEEGQDIEAQDNAGNTPLMNAALEGRIEIVSYLISQGANPNVRNIDGDTPLIDSASNSHFETVEFLLRHGANPWLENKRGHTALDELHAYNDDSPDVNRIMKVLQDGCRKYADALGGDTTKAAYEDDKKKYEERSNQSRSNNSRRFGGVDDVPLIVTGSHALHTLREKSLMGDAPYVLAYLQSGFKRDPESLSLAARAGHDDLVNFFIALTQGNINARSGPGKMSALMRSVGRNHLRTVELLLNNGAKVKLKSEEGYNSLYYAENGLYVLKEEIELLKSFAEKESTGSDDTKNTHVVKSKQKKKRSVSTNEHQDQELPPAKKSKKSKDTLLAHPHIGEANKTETAKDKILPSKAADKSLAQPVHSKSDTGSKSKQQVEKKYEKPIIEKLPRHDPEVVSKSVEHKEKVVHEKQEDESKPKLSSDEEAISRLKRSEEEEEKRKAALLKEEQERKERLIREEQEKKEAELRAEQERKREEEFAAKRNAEAERRKQQFLSDLQAGNKRHQEKLQELERQNEERKKRQLEELEAKKKEEERQRELMSKKGEEERRQSIREKYPTGLRNMTFSETVRSREDVVQFLPLYVVSLHGVKHIIDFHLIIILGLESFLEKYSDRFSSTKPLTLDQKRSIFNFYYPFCASPSLLYADQTHSNFTEEMAKFGNLRIQWLKLDEVLLFLKDEFPELEPVVSSRTLELDIHFDNANSEVIKPPVISPSALPPPTFRNASRLPLRLRSRPAIVKTLNRLRKIW